MRLRDPVWVRGGREIAVVESKGKLGGRVWIVDAKGGQATPVTDESVQAQAPAFSADGRRMAYFASDSAGRTQVWVQEITNSVNTAGPPTQLTNHTDVTLTRIRWVPDASALLYSADGCLWKVNASGGQPSKINFTAELSFTRPERALPPARFPEPGQREFAKGFMGLA